MADARLAIGLYDGPNQPCGAARTGVVARIASQETKMAWTTLASRLNGLPHVLAGPVLRQVTKQSVTVWVAVRLPATVDLTVLDASGTKMSGSRHTVALGTNLHIVAVTAKTSADVLTEGIIYRYDMTFHFDGGTSESLAAATAEA